MNDKLFLKKKVNIKNNHIGFLNFIHPHFNVVDNLYEYDNPLTHGIIYTGKLENDTISIIEKITNKWIIVNNFNYDVDLSTNEGLIKNTLPLDYVNIKSSDSLYKDFLYNISYDSLIEKIKICLIDGSKLKYDGSHDASVYTLFNSLLCFDRVFDETFFNTVSKDNINVITSSLLTMLNRTQSVNVKGVSDAYANLIVQSNRRYGKRIQPNIIKFVKSKSNAILALYSMLASLNRVR